MLSFSIDFYLKFFVCAIERIKFFLNRYQLQYLYCDQFLNLTIELNLGHHLPAETQKYAMTKCLSLTGPFCAKITQVKFLVKSIC